MLMFLITEMVEGNITFNLEKGCFHQSRINFLNISIGGFKNLTRVTQLKILRSHGGPSVDKGTSVWLGTTFLFASMCYSKAP